ncbi:MAG: UvrB/UvrC motif-containing protein [Anaerotruncus sp.]|nr:MAG: UvrB/UvrC motif-containing protein [Anaerotruncus sp.]
MGKNITYTEVPDEPQSKEEAAAEQPKSELEKLKEDMKLAIKEQRFEDAAVIRDKIKELGEKE